MVNGILGKKVSMTQVFDESGEAIPVTVLVAGPCPVIQVKTEDREGYNAVQLGFGTKDEKKANKSSGCQIDLQTIVLNFSPKE